MQMRIRDAACAQRTERLLIAILTRHLLRHRFAQVSKYCEPPAVNV